MKFDYDPHKSALNKQKHGIDFVEAQLLWNDPDLLEVAARADDELRYLVIGMIGGRSWSAVITYSNEAIRIISVLRSRSEEMSLYES